MDISAIAGRLPVVFVVAAGKSAIFLFPVLNLPFPLSFLLPLPSSLVISILPVRWPFVVFPASCEGAL